MTQEQPARARSVPPEIAINPARKDCGCVPWGPGGTLVLLLALVLFVAVALLLAGGFALLAFLGAMPWGALGGDAAKGPVGSAVLIAPALALLVVIAFLLLLLLWCSCGRSRALGDLLRLLPGLRDAAQGLKAAGDALLAMERSLRDAQVPVRATGTALNDAGDQVNVTIPVASAVKRHFDLLGADVVVGLQTTDWQPFGDVKTQLAAAGGKLQGQPESLDAKLGAAADQCHAAGEALKAIAGALGAG